ncbi:P-loop containing nucleoside triphosphate hydrolase protein [Tribonema minus]|uniref:microtubule-severing ATPase n=1 Tax=Tribonema minus TaxID=303371 RepID=A0A835YKR4_9STRA|nr:P-loop containing nucleoside triphosphate hydrolase protein [Tribonema minus]
MSSDRLRALAALERAVAAEKEGRYDYAVPMYTQGIELLMQVVKTQTRNDDRRRLTSEIEEFMKRAERVKQLQEQRQAVGAATSSRSRSSSTSATSLLSSVASHLMPTASSLGGSRQQHLSRQAIIMEELLDRSPGVVWDDIAGLAEAKQTLQEAVILPNLRPDLFTGLRAPPRGVLLYGPPGTGKTMLAKAVATESNFTFFSISASSLTSKYVGEGEKLVRALFRAARARRPSVVFVDEIDSLLSARGAGEHEASRRLKTEFMVQLDGACTGGEGDEGGLLVMGATNLPWELDEAVLRRLARRVYVPLPDGAARAALVARLLRGQSARLSKADVAAVVAASEGYSCSDLAAVTKEAAMQPLRDLGSNIRTARANQVRPITLADFERALGVITPSVAPQSLARFQRWEAGER